MNWEERDRPLRIDSVSRHKFWVPVIGGRNENGDKKQHDKGPTKET